MRVGIIDLGTNSVRFAIYDLDELGHYETVYKKKLMLRPGQGVFNTGQLKKTTIRALTDAFQKFARRATTAGVESVLAVGTSALREAKNASEVVTRIERKSGIRVKVISGAREAQLIARGILAFDKLPRAAFTLFDIGGGSTEVSLCRGTRRLKSLSLPLGALRLQQLYLPHGAAAPLPERVSAVLQMRLAIQKLLVKQLGRKHPPVNLAIGSSGTIRAVARLIDRRHAGTLFSMRRKKKKPLLGFPRSQLKELVDRMLTLNKTELTRLPGMERRRLDIILSGSILLLELMEFLSVDRLRTSNYALRDGLLLDAAKAVRGRKRP